MYYVMVFDERTDGWFECGPYRWWITAKVVSWFARHDAVESIKIFTKSQRDHFHAEHDSWWDSLGNN